jgi:fibronectin type III domain protein
MPISGDDLADYPLAAISEKYALLSNTNIRKTYELERPLTLDQSCDAQHRDHTTFGYSDLKLTSGKSVRLSFRLANTGARAGAEVAEAYAVLPANSGEPPKRLVGWSKVTLDRGESKEVTIGIDPWYLSVFDVDRDAWELLPGEYTFLVGGSSRSLPLKGSINLK